jgi:hypothetical protein
MEETPATPAAKSKKAGPPKVFLNWEPVKDRTIGQLFEGSDLKQISSREVLGKIWVFVKKHNLRVLKSVPGASSAQEAPNA